jgi:hypothetical protein
VETKNGEQGSAQGCKGQGEGVDTGGFYYLAHMVVPHEHVKICHGGVVGTFLRAHLKKSKMFCNAFMHVFYVYIYICTYRPQDVIGGKPALS